MILTGKAKDDFLSFYGTGENYFKTILNEIEQYAHIIEWFDSVGLPISINYVSFFDELRNDKGYEAYVTNIEKGISVKFRSVETRQQATEQAIIKATEIYNELNK